MFLVSSVFTLCVFHIWSFFTSFGLCFWCRRIMLYCSVLSKNNCNNMFVFMPWKLLWLVGSWNNLFKPWLVRFNYY